MDPATLLPSRKRSTDTSTDWSLCLLCQKDTWKKPARKLGQQGLQKLLQTIDERKWFNDVEHFEILGRLQASNLDELCQKVAVLYHKDCYATFTSSLHLNRLKNKVDNASTGSESTEASSTQNEARTALRSVVKAANFDLCIFCQTKTTENNNRTIATIEVSDNVLKAAGSDYTMRCRLAGVIDLVASDARYHLKCYVRFLRKHTSDGTSYNDNPQKVCIERVAEELKCGMRSGAVYTLLDVWERYSQLLSEFQVDAGSYRVHKTWFKRKLHRLLDGQVEFVAQLEPHQPQLVFPSVSAKIVVQALKQTQDELEDTRSQQGLHSSNFTDTETEEMLALHHTALRIRADIKELPQFNNCARVNQKDAAKLVPQSLYMFLSVLLTGDPDEDEEDGWPPCSIAQDLVYGVTKGQSLTPKHIGLGLAIHQATRSKRLVNLIHSAGHCASYNQVRCRLVITRKSSPGRCKL